MLFKVKYDDKITEINAEDKDSLYRLLKLQGANDIQILNDGISPKIDISNLNVGDDSNVSMNDLIANMDMEDGQNIPTPKVEFYDTYGGGKPSHSIPQRSVHPPQPQEVQGIEFAEGGVEFKVVGNMVFKKSWETTDDKDVRVINAKNSKIYKGDQFKVQKVKWVKIK